MEKKVIIQRFKKVTNGKEFLSLVNEMNKERHGEKAFMFRSYQLYRLRNSNLQYRFSTIPKKSGGVRQIAAPSKKLKVLLTYTKDILSAFYAPKECVQGFTTGRSVVGNANMHLHQNYVFNVDLSDFFPSISQARVWKRLQCKPYNFPDAVCRVIADLCCVNYPKEDGTFFKALPQGAPTSPILSNMVCERLDYLLTGLARRFGLHFSRYADDMTFSSMHNVYQPDGEFVKELKRIVLDQGFLFNERKTRLHKRGQRQEVTGLTVGVKANVTRDYVNEVRSILHVWEKFGYEKAFVFYCERYLPRKGYREGIPVLERVIEGKLNYLNMVKGSADSTYKRLYGRFTKLMEDLNKQNEVKNQSADKQPELESNQNENSSTAKQSCERIHCPQKMIEFLSKFSRDDRFKWFTHKSDSPLDLCAKRDAQVDNFKYLDRYCYGERASIRESLLRHVKNFINLRKDYILRDQNSEEIKVKWFDMVEMSRKSENERLWPGELIKDGTRFETYINRFKRTIEFRTDCDRKDKFRYQIKNLFKANLTNEIEVVYTDSFEELSNNVNVYCFVNTLFKGLSQICKWIESYKALGNRVIVDLKQETDFYRFSILHEGSYFSCSDNKLDGLGGDLKMVRVELFSICDFEMIGDFRMAGISGNNVKRVVCLDDETRLKEINGCKEGEGIITFTKCKIEDVEGQVGGVKYMLKLYRR